MYHYKIIKAPISNYDEFEFKYYDSKFIEYHKVFFSFKSKMQKRHHVGIILSISGDTVSKDGYCNILTNEKIATLIEDNNLEIYLGRGESGIIYLYASTNIIVSVNLQKIELEYYKNGEK